MTTNYVCSKIEWDTDGDRNLLNELPKTMTIAVPNDITDYQDDDAVSDYLSDKLSDETGFCHFGFDFTVAV